MRYLALIFLVPVHCSTRSMNDMGFKAYNADGKIVNEIKAKDIKYVDWDHQCYFFTDDKVTELKKLNLLGGKIDLIFENDILISIYVSSVFSSQLPKGYFMPCSEGGEILIEDGKLCLQKLDGSNEEVLSNDRYHNFLMEANLLK
jgi:hypothetical protein